MVYGDNHMKGIRAIAACVVLSLLSGCGISGSGDSTAATTKFRIVTVKGSDTMVILGQRWAETYMHHNPGITVQVTGGGSGIGIAALINGGTDICAASRPMKDKEKEDLKAKRGAEAIETKV